MENYHTIVVGMGVAGITAASTLAQAGLKVLALEAMDRLGGRVHTVPFGDGVVELGAEWIHGTGLSKPYDLAMNNNVQVTEQDLSLELFASDGSKVNENLVNELLALVMESFDEKLEINEPLGHFVTKKIKAHLKNYHPDVLNDKDFLSGFFNFADLLVDNYIASNSWNDVTTISTYKTLEGHQHVSWHTNGYKTLIEILLNKYKNGTGLPTLTIQLNTEVAKITYSDNPHKNVTIVTRNGTKYTAENVIVTVSLGVLKARHKELFEPTLPKTKTNAIQNISMGVMDKIILLFDKAWWPVTSPAFFGFLWKEDDLKTVCDEDFWTTKVYAASQPKGCHCALTLWTSGEFGKLIETLPEEKVKMKLMGLLRRFIGKDINIPEPINMVRSTWFHNPYTLGSYSYDSLLTPHYVTARTDLEAPITDSVGNPRVLFAGEATNLHYFSTVHGAMDTGHREAMRLLKRRIKSSL